MRKGDGADGQRAKLMGNVTTEDEGEERMQQALIQSRGSSSYNEGVHTYGCRKSLIRTYLHCAYSLIFSSPHYVHLCLFL